MRKYITAITTRHRLAIKSFHMAVFIFLQFTVKLFQRKLIWEQKHLCMKCRCTKRSSKASTAVWVTKVKLAFTWQCKFLSFCECGSEVKLKGGFYFTLHFYLKSLCASPKSRNILVSVTTDRDSHVWSAVVFRALQSQWDTVRYKLESPLKI